MHYHSIKGEFAMSNFSLGRFPEMYVTLEGTPLANCPTLLVVIILLVIAGCLAPPLYVYRRKIYYKLVMIVYRRRKDKLARKLKKRMRTYAEGTPLPLQEYKCEIGSCGDMNTTCLICMDALLDVNTTDLVILLDACGHRFHFQCILRWLDVSDGCPICRKNVDVNDQKALRLVYLDCRPLNEVNVNVDESGESTKLDTSVNYNGNNVTYVSLALPCESTKSEKKMNFNCFKPKIEKELIVNEHLEYPTGSSNPDNQSSIINDNSSDDNDETFSLMASHIKDISIQSHAKPCTSTSKHIFVDYAYVNEKLDQNSDLHSCDITQCQD